MRNTGPEFGRVAITLSRRDRPSELHPRWRELLDLAHRAELLTELGPDELERRLELRTAELPDISGWTSILVGYYGGGEGDACDGEWRRQRERVLICHSHEPRSADVIVEKIRLALPDVGDLELATETGRGIGLKAGDVRVPIRDVRREREDADLVTVSIRAIVCATNAVLATRQRERRFVPLRAATGVEVYAGLRHEQMHALSDADLLAAPLSRLLSFAFFGPTAPPAAETQKIVA